VDDHLSDDQALQGGFAVEMKDAQLSHGNAGRLHVDWQLNLRVSDVTHNLSN
jgi:hypothetical protein